MESVNFYISLQVTFRDPEAARRACADATPIIDGRRANCNLASLGAQHRGASYPPFSSVCGEKKRIFIGVYLCYLSKVSVCELCLSRV